MKRQKATLYISYDGLTDPLGYSQVFQYLINLQFEGLRLVVLTYEKNTTESASLYKEILKKFEERNVLWVPLRYHKTPTVPATLFDVFQGVFKIFLLSFRYRFEIVHARSYVSALITLFPKYLMGARFIFDMRGFWADEKMETGGHLWRKNGFLYRLVKKLEQVFLLSSDRIISLSLAAKKPILQLLPTDAKRQVEEKFEVIRTCADLNRFKLASPHSHPKKRMVLGHIGAVGLWYDFEAAVRFYLEFKSLAPRPVDFFILNKGEHERIQNLLKKYCIRQEEVQLFACPPEKMAEKLSVIDAVCFFIRPSFSKLASSPTKLGELLGMGIPCLTNKGIGDVDLILEDRNCGVLVEDFSSKALKEGAQKFIKLLEDPSLAMRCRQTAEKYYSLENALKRYRSLYSELLAKDNEPSMVNNYARL